MEQVALVLSELLKQHLQSQEEARKLEHERKLEAIRLEQVREEAKLKLEQARADARENARKETQEVLVATLSIVSKIGDRIATLLRIKLLNVLNLL